jgi:hypothetical protein
MARTVIATGSPVGAHDQKPRSSEWTKRRCSSVSIARKVRRHSSAAGESTDAISESEPTNADAVKRPTL